VGWAALMQPYLKNTQVLQCTHEPTRGSDDPTSNDYTDYWYNSNLVGRSQTRVEHGSSTVMSGDGSSRNSKYVFAGGGEIKDDGTAASPGTARGKAQAPDQDEGGRFGVRHFDGINFLFVDGHVKWFRSKSSTDLNEVWNGATTHAQSGSGLTFYCGPAEVVKKPASLMRPAASPTDKL
jgi:prepilin-type processing-associated H-X9-DG protein